MFENLGFACRYLPMVFDVDVQIDSEIAQASDRGCGEISRLEAFRNIVDCGDFFLVKRVNGKWTELKRTRKLKNETICSEEH